MEPNGEEAINTAWTIPKMQARGETRAPGSVTDRSSRDSNRESEMAMAQRSICRIRALRDKYLKAADRDKSFKVKLREKVTETCRCSKQKWKQFALSVFPFVRVMGRYSWRSDLPGDVVSGLTVGVMQLPQGMAYSMLADLPPVVGLYMSFFPVIVYLLFGTSRQISIGTVAVVSLMTGGVVAGQTTLWRREQGIDGLMVSENASREWADEEMAFKISVAASVSFVAGLVQIALGLLRAGFVTTYMGDSLVSGFTTGAALHVLTSQVKHVFGLSIPRFPNLLQIINTYVAILTRIGDTNLATLLTSVVIMAVLCLVKAYANDRFQKKFKMPVPIELIVVVASTLACHYGDLRGRWSIQVVGKIPAGLPEPRFPAFPNISDYASDCLIIALVAFAQSVSLAVLLASKNQYHIDPNKELIGYGMGTLFGSFFSCYPVAASVSRSSVQDSAGGRTQVASLVSAALVLLVIIFIGPLFENLPNCALSAIIIVSLKTMLLQVLDLKALFTVSRFDFAIWIVTFLCVIVLHVDMGLLAGIVFACFTVVIRSQRARVTTLESLSETGDYRSVRLYRKTDPIPDVRVVSYNSALYYANSDLFLKHVHRETQVKPERMRKLIKKMLLNSDPRHVSKVTYDQNNKEKSHLGDLVTEMETVLPRQERFQVAKGNRPHSGADVRKVSMIGPSSNLDPRPFLYLVIDCSSFSFVDLMGVKTLKELIEDYTTVGITTYLAAVTDDVWDTMEHAGFAHTYDSLMFVTVRDAVLAAQEDNRKRTGTIFDCKHNLTNLDRVAMTTPLLSESPADDDDGSSDYVTGEEHETGWTHAQVA